MGHAAMRRSRIERGKASAVSLAMLQLRCGRVQLSKTPTVSWATAMYM